LTSPGLSAIYSGIVESRRIFRKLKAYVTYRFAASIQIVIVLSVLIYASDCPITALFIIILALFNDITMLPIAYDYQQAGSLPENPDVTKILTTSFLLGLMETGFSLLFAYAAIPSSLAQDTYLVQPQCDVPTQGIIWLQLFVSTELLIFSARAPSYFPVSLAPSPAIVLSVLTGCIIASLMAGLSTTFGGLHIVDIVLTWVFCIICLFVIDVAKVSIFRSLGENTNVLPDMVETSVSDKGHGKHDAEDAVGVSEVKPEPKVHHHSVRLSEFAENTRMSIADPNIRESYAPKSMSSGQRKSQIASVLQRESFVTSGKISVNHDLSAGDLRPSLVSSGRLRPHVPSNNVTKLKGK